MSRVQLALNVSDIDSAVEFYERLFGTSPAKRRPGYANFAIEDPPLKLVLFEDQSQQGEGFATSLNHLGVEVATTDEVMSTQDRLRAEGLELSSREEATCCYALQDKFWVSGPNDAAWEFYTVLEDSPELALTGADAVAGQSCCSDSNATVEVTMGKRC